MRKRRLLGMAALATMLVLSGCSGSSDDAGTTPAGNTGNQDESKSENGESEGSIRDQLLGLDQTLSADDWEAARVEGGFDEKGYKDADYDEIMDAGKPCDGWAHFSGSGASAANSLEMWVKAKNVSLYAYEDEDYPMDNYYALDSYGEVHSYYETYTYYLIEDEDYPGGASGQVIIISDTVTGELMCIETLTDDVDALKNISEAALKAVAANFATNYTFNTDFDKCIESGEGAGYFEYGTVWFDIEYENEPSNDYWQYVSWVYKENR